jgi:hypothetical protein
VPRLNGETVAPGRLGWGVVLGSSQVMCPGIGRQSAVILRSDGSESTECIARV